jgi:phosphoserine phosphatase
VSSLNEANAMNQFHLIVQAANVETVDLKTLHALSGAKGIEQCRGNFRHQAFCLLDANIASSAMVAAHCQQAGLDYGFVPKGSALTDFGLIALDMDSTLITIECIDEIADLAGKKNAVSAVTAAAMRGEIDWPTSLRQRVAKLAGLPETSLQEVYEERVKLSPGAESLIDAAKNAGIGLLLVSGGFSYFTDKLKARLGIDFAFSNRLETANGFLTGQVIGSLCDAAAKARHLREVASKMGLRDAQLLAIGDGANDLDMMAAAGTSIAYRAKPVVRERASYAFDHVGLDAVLALFPVDLKR